LKPLGEEPDAIVAEYSRKAGAWERMERRFIGQARRFRALVAPRVSTEKLGELAASEAPRAILPTALTFGGGN